MIFFKKKAKPLNVVILRQYRAEAFGRLDFIGSWSGYWKTKIDGVYYRSSPIFGAIAMLGGANEFVRRCIIDRVQLRKYPEKHKSELLEARYGGYRYVSDNGDIEQWHW